MKLATCKASKANGAGCVSNEIIAGDLMMLWGAQLSKNKVRGRNEGRLSMSLGMQNGQAQGLADAVQPTNPFYTHSISLGSHSLAARETRAASRSSTVHGYGLSWPGLFVSAFASSLQHPDQVD